MVEFETNYAPYAFTGNVLDILDRQREASLPEVIDAQTVVRLGVSEGNAHRTVKALEFLGLIDENGGKTASMEALKLASAEEYPTVLGDIVRKAYSYIFELVNPAKATETNIMDAFRGTKPSSQWQRAAKLFIGLCQKAKIIPGEPATIDQPIAKPASNKRPSTQRQSFLTMFGGNEYLANLEPLFQQLPPFNGSRSWNSDTRAKWLKAFESMLDLLIEVED